MGVLQELSVFLSAVLSGVMAAAVYGILRILRRILRHSLFWVSMEDLVYWTWCGLYLFSELHRTCSGRIRWYYVIGVLLGGGVFSSILFNFIKNRIDKSGKTE